MSELNFSDKEQILRFAMQKEKDAMEYYAEAAKNSTQPLGRNMFLSLVEDEKKHYEWLEALLKSTVTPEAPVVPGDVKERFEGLFEESRRESRTPAKGAASDLEALDRAEERERLAYRYYKEAAARTPNAAVKQLCERLAAFENEHVQLITNARLYLTDPRDWFTWEEGPSLDGG